MQLYVLPKNGSYEFGVVTLSAWPHAVGFVVSGALASLYADAPERACGGRYDLFGSLERSIDSIGSQALNLEERTNFGSNTSHPVPGPLECDWGIWR